MSPRKAPWLWGCVALLFVGLTVYLLPCVPCPPEAHGLIARRGCVPCGGEDRMTPYEWLRIKVRFAR